MNSAVKYSRSHPYRRGSSYTKTLVTGIETVRFKVERVISRTDNTVSAPILEANKTTIQSGTVIGDTTKARALESRAMNEVYVLLSDGGQLLHLGVNSDWPIVVADAIISDNEPGLINALKTERRQLSILHALKYLLFTLWGEGMNKNEKVEVDKANKQALFTLVNSTRKHLKDRDKEQLKARIDTTLRELQSIAEEMEGRLHQGICIHHEERKVHGHVC